MINQKNVFSSFEKVIRKIPNSGVKTNIIINIFYLSEKMCTFETEIAYKNSIIW